MSPDDGRQIAILTREVPHRWLETAAIETVRCRRRGHGAGRHRAGQAVDWAACRPFGQGVSAKVQKQRKADVAADDNPLGRVLLAGEAHAGDDIETLEVKLGEAIIKERPAIQRGLPLIKIIAMVAPLMGLLGTVTGMIIVFQAITIYGAGDPKAMAGGISSALVTTVLGLIVAIPMLLCHTLLHGRARNLLHILEEQTAGIVAQRVGR